MALDALSVLIGTWEITGRTFDASEDNIAGSTVIEAILDGTVLQMKGRMRFNDRELESLEIVWRDPVTGGFAAHVYSTMGAPLVYRWECDGKTLVHAGAGATFTGTISADGTTITGSWNPDPGQPVHAGAAYEAVMRRIT
ncbi:MAG: DUF1579 domain-containing protein [Bacillota bacterium]|nr:DUF1579 domain-containing protein [Bacillota bacterium]